jgi:hypothetical protein
MGKSISHQPIGQCIGSYWLDYANSGTGANVVAYGKGYNHLYPPPRSPAPVCVCLARYLLVVSVCLPSMEMTCKEKQRGIDQHVIDSEWMGSHHSGNCQCDHRNAHRLSSADAFESSFASKSKSRVKNMLARALMSSLSTFWIISNSLEIQTRETFNILITTTFFPATYAAYRGRLGTLPISRIITNWILGVGDGDRSLSRSRFAQGSVSTSNGIATYFNKNWLESSKNKSAN